MRAILSLTFIFVLAYSNNPLLLADGGNPYRGETIVVDTKDSNIATEIIGTGNIPVVLIHGLGLARQVWYPTVAELEDSNQKIIIYDLSTHGKSTIKSYPPTIDKHVNDVYDLISSLAIEKFIIIGHSYGGRIAQRYIELYPDQIAALGLISSWHGPFADKDLKTMRTKFKFALLINQITKKLPKWMIPDYIYYFSRSPNLNDYFDFNECMISRAAIRPENGTVMSYLIHAKKDYTIPLRLGLKCANYWDAHVTIIDGYIHQIPSARPKILAMWIKSIIDDVRSGPPWGQSSDPQVFR